MDRITLKNKSLQIWNRYTQGSPLTPDDKKVLREAYWDSALPKVQGYNLSQWVEDGFPQILF